jgi:hypothetical protein
MNDAPGRYQTWYFQRIQIIEVGQVYFSASKHQHTTTENINSD